MCLFLWDIKNILIVMRFTKEDAVKGLVGNMTSKGEKLSLSDRSISECMDNLYTMIAVEDMELSEFLDKAMPFFKTANSNVRNDVSAGIRKYMEENPAQKPEEVNKGGNVDTHGDAALDAILKRMEEMENRLKEGELNAKRESIKASIVSRLNEKGVTDREWIEGLLSEVSVNEDLDIDGKVEKYLMLYNKSKAAVNPDITPEGGGGGRTADEALADRIKEIKTYAESQRLV